MKKLYRIVAFVAVFALLFWGLDTLLWDNAQVCTTWKEITGRDKPEVLIMGSSHAHTGIIPAMLGGKTAILSNDAASMQLTYLNLMTVLHYYTPRVIILETQVILDTQYDRLRGDRKALLLDVLDGIPNIWDKWHTAVVMMDFDDIPLGLSQLTRPQMIWSRWLPKSQIPRDTDGFVRRDTYASGEVNGRRQTDYMEETGSAPLDPVNARYLEKFLALAAKRGIRVWILKVPVPMPDSESAAQMHTLEAMEGVEGVLDFQYLISEELFTPGECNDPMHFNRRGAAIFTPLLREALLEEGIDIGETAPWYAGETVTAAGEGLWEYSLRVSDGSRVDYLLDGEPVKGEGGALLSVPPEEADRVTAVFTDRDGETRLPFMTPSTCILTDKKE